MADGKTQKARSKGRGMDGKGMGPKMAALGQTIGLPTLKIEL